eukprot:11210276-Lingulodinium_polyedra.AAC.1
MSSSAYTQASRGVNKTRNTKPRNPRRGKNAGRGGPNAIPRPKRNIQPCACAPRRKPARRNQRSTQTPR